MKYCKMLRMMCPIAGGGLASCGPKLLGPSRAPSVDPTPRQFQRQTHAGQAIDVVSDCVHASRKQNVAGPAVMCRGGTGLRAKARIGTRRVTVADPALRPSKGPCLIDLRLGQLPAVVRARAMREEPTKKR